MSKHIHNHKWRIAPPIASTTFAASILFALAAQGAFAQGSLPAETAQRPAKAKAQAEASVALSLQQAIALALDNNPELAAARREVEASDGQLLQSQTRPNPELAYLLEDRRSETRTQTMQLNLPIELGGKRSARISAAERGREIAAIGLDARRQDIRASVVTAFFDTLASQERAALAQDSVTLAKRATDAVAKRVVAGKVSPVEETKARVAEAGVRMELAQAQSEQRNARARLASLLGVTAPRFSLVEGKVDLLPTVPTPDNIQQRLSMSPTLRLAQMEVERRKALVDVERSKRMPDLTVSVGVKRPNELDRNQVLFGVSIPIPLFDRNQGNLLEALRREDKARDELAAANARFGTEVQQAYERVSVLHDEVEMLQSEVLPGAKSAYDAATIGFENGKFNFLEVLDAQRTYFAAKTQYLKALADAHRAAADIDRILGQANIQE